MCCHPPGSVRITTAVIVFGYFRDFLSGSRQIHVNVIFIGPAADGTDSSWLSLPAESFDPGMNAADITVAALDETSMTYDAQNTAYGLYLNSITSPYDNQVYGYDEATGRFWQLFLNGTAASEGASSIAVADGDTLVWYYSATGATVPNVGTGL